MSQNIVYDLTHKTSLPDLELWGNPNLNQNKPMPKILFTALEVLNQHPK